MASVDLVWEGGEHTFELKIKHLRALQDKCNAGPEHILERLATKRWLVDDVIQPIRLGLEGGGLDTPAANELVRSRMEEGSLAQFIQLSHTILAAAIYGFDQDDMVGEEEAEMDQESQPLKTEKSDGQKSSEPGPQ